jgi:hypothetical protein
MLRMTAPETKKDRKEDPPICPNSFYENLKISIEKRLLDDEEADLPKWARVLDPKVARRNSKSFDIW